MNANHEHILSTVQVRFAATFPNENFSLKGSDFDRWLAERDARIRAAAEQRGAVKALREARSDWFQYADAINDTPSKYYPALWLKNRADLLEGDDG